MVSLGPINYYNHDNFNELAKLVKSSENKELDAVVLRKINSNQKDVNEDNIYVINEI